MSAPWIHRVRCSDSSVESTTSRIKSHLGVSASAEPFGDGSGFWAVDFTTAERDVDLDFLRPDILPPR